MHNAVGRKSQAMSVATSSSATRYGRRRAALTKKKENLPRLPKSQPAERTTSTYSDITNLQTQAKSAIGAMPSSLTKSSIETRSAYASLNYTPNSSTDKHAGSQSSLRDGMPREENAISGFYPFRMGVPARMSSVSSVIDERYRDSLQRYYRLLMTHIVITDDIIKQLAEEKILPETMIKDIQEAETREEKNECLLKFLHLRGNKSYKRFRELMYRSGNFFVADLLWDEGDGTGTLQVEDLAKYPGLLKCVPEAHRKKLTVFLEAKIRERALMLAWKLYPEERMQALSNKVTEFNQEKTFRDTIASQQKKIQDLESSLAAEEDTSRGLRLEVSGQQQRVQQLKKEHTVVLDTQTRFHDANLSTIVRLKERLTKARESVRELNEVVKRKLEVGATGDSDGGGGEGDEGPEDDLSLVSLERNVRKLVFELRHEKERATMAAEERQEVLTLLNRRYTKEPLVAVVKEVLKHEQKHRSLVMRDILRLADTLRQLLPTGGQAAAPSTLHPLPSTTSTTTTATLAPLLVIPDLHHHQHQLCGGDGSDGGGSNRRRRDLPDPSLLDTKHFKAQLAMLNAQVEHIHKRLLWKDSELADRQEEILSLKERLGEAISIATQDPDPDPDPELDPGSAPNSSSTGSPPQFTTPTASTPVSATPSATTTSPSPVSSSSQSQQRSPKQPNSTPTDLQGTGTSQVSSPNSHNHNHHPRLPTSPSPRRGGVTPWAHEGRPSPKTVTFQDGLPNAATVSSSSTATLKPRARTSRSSPSARSGGKRDVVSQYRPDPDKTLVNAEHYLSLEEGNTDEDDNEEEGQVGGEIYFRGRGRTAPTSPAPRVAVAPKVAVAPSHGEGDIISPSVRRRSGGGGGGGLLGVGGGEVRGGGGVARVTRR